MKVIYVAGPLTTGCFDNQHRVFDLRVWQANVTRAVELAADLTNAGFAVICVHPAALYGHIEEKTAIEADFELLRRSDAVALTEGWEKSTGTLGEIKLADELRKPRFGQWVDQGPGSSTRGSARRREIVRHAVLWRDGSVKVKPKSDEAVNRALDSDLVDYEAKTLSAILCGTDLQWGAALGQAIEALKGNGFITDELEVTHTGIQALAGRGLLKLPPGFVINQLGSIRAPDANSLRYQAVLAAYPGETEQQAIAAAWRMLSNRKYKVKP